MEGRGFPRAGRAAPSNFPRGKPKGNPWRAALPAQQNPVLPESFTQIYILFPICFRIDPPKMHRWFRICLPKILWLFCIGPPKIHRGFRIGSPQVTFNLLPQEFHSQRILCTIAIMQEKQQHFLFLFFLNRMPFLPNKDIRLIVCIQSDRKRVF